MIYPRGAYSKKWKEQKQLEFDKKMKEGKESEFEGIRLGWEVVELSNLMTLPIEEPTMLKEELLEEWAKHLLNEEVLVANNEIDRLSVVKQFLENVYDVGVEAGMEQEKLKNQLEQPAYVQPPTD